MESEEEHVEPQKNAIQPTEDRDGDDELKENGIDSSEETRPKRRSRRVVRVEEGNFIGLSDCKL